MARAFTREGESFVARLDEMERFMLTGLMEQTRHLLAPEVEVTGDVFADLAASMGVSLASEDQARDGSGGDASGGDDDDDVDERDPALGRLLPDAHRGDEQVAAEFRRLTEEGLRQRKSSNLDIAMATLASADGDRVELDDREAQAFVTALTDVRLLLGERMGMRTEEDAERLHAAMEDIDDDDPLGWAMVWYDFLTWLQESLAHALIGDPWGPSDDEVEEADEEGDVEADEAAGAAEGEAV